jgi:hypothetical protein
MEGPMLRTKLQAGASQIETVIWLRFNGGGPVSIHTLCCAGYAIVRDLSELVGGDMMLCGEHVNPEETQETEFAP